MSNNTQQNQTQGPNKQGPSNSSTISCGVAKDSASTLPNFYSTDSGVSTMNFFQAPGGPTSSRASSEADIGTMDDMQFNASLDALLNGDQLTIATGAQASSSSNNNNNNGMVATQSFPANPQHQTAQQQHPVLSNSQQFLVAAPGTSLAATQGSLTQSQQQQQQLHQQPTMAVPSGLPMASTNQAVLQQLVPQGAHGAAQMSLSAGHAAATGSFPSGSASVGVAGLPQQIVAAASQGQPAFQWASMPGNVAVSVAGSSAPTVSSTGISGAPSPSKTSSSSSGRGGKRPRSARDVSAVSEDEGERERRRQDRNLREQQRSHKITEQIAQLRDVLSAANLQFKPDKYSTLTKVVEYIKSLQERSQVLDQEHKKLLDTISETNEIVNNQYVPAYTSGSDAPSVSNDLMADGSSSSLEDESTVFVRGIDYKIAFKGCGIPLSLASIDGRFLDCNDTFLELTGYAREELLPLEKPGGNNNTAVSFSPEQSGSQERNLSLFNLLSRDGMEQVFMAMSEMLKQPGSIGTAAAKPSTETKLADFWSGPVKLCRQDDLPVKLNVTLVRTSQGRPKFFNCALTALTGDDSFKLDDQTTITSPSQSLSDSTKGTNTSNEQQQRNVADAPDEQKPEATSSSSGKKQAQSSDGHKLEQGTTSEQEDLSKTSAIPDKSSTATTGMSCDLPVPDKNTSGPHVAAKSGSSQEPASTNSKAENTSERHKNDTCL